MTLLHAVHEDEHLLVLDKPAGLLCVPGRGDDKQDCLSARALRQWPDALVVHRLDMATSGLLLMARGVAAQRALGAAFEARRVHKRYEAVVEGRLPLDGAWHDIDAPLAADWPRRPRQKIDRDAGKPSLTRWRALRHLADGTATQVELMPVTGRSHQLRVHLLSIGHPILGDALYGGEAAGRAPRLLLHATRLVFEHPAHGQRCRFDCPATFDVGSDGGLILSCRDPSRLTKSSMVTRG